MPEPILRDNIQTMGENPTVQPSCTTAENMSGDGSALASSTSNNATSPMDVDTNDDVATDIAAPFGTISQINNAKLAVITTEAEAKVAPVASAPLDKSPPRDQDHGVAPPAATAPPTAAKMDGDSAPTMEDAISSNGVASPIITRPAADNNTNSDAAAAAVIFSSSRNSPMNILAEIASVESPTGEDQHSQKNDDLEMNNDGCTLPFESLAHNDIILSLKDGTYKTIMYQFFRKLEENMKDGAKDEEEEEKKMNDEVYNLLKNAGGRLLNYIDYRRPNLGFIQVDAETARTKIGNDINRRNESKGTWGVIVPSKSISSQHTLVVPQNIFLSLKDDFYRETLFSYFRKLGAISESQRNNEEEKRAKEEAYHFFKTSGGILVQHHDWKKPDLGFYEVDEEYARNKISDDISRRLETKDRWEVVEDGAADKSSATSPAAKPIGFGMIDLHKLAQIASGEDEEKLPDRSRVYNAANVVHVPPVGAPPVHVPPVGAPPVGAPPVGAPPVGAPPVGAPPVGAESGKENESFANMKEPHGNTGNTYSYLDIYTLEYLKTWMTMPSHIEDPYPTEADKAQIIRDTGIAKNALYNWFVSNRTRKWKPAYKKIRIKYGLDKATPLTPEMKVELAKNIFAVHESAGYLDGVFSNEGVLADDEMDTKRKGTVLPQPWEEYFDDDTNYFYYHNPVTGAVQWKHPAFGGDEHIVPIVPAPKPSPQKRKPPKELFSAEDLTKTAKFNVGGNLFEVLCSSLPNSQESRIAQTALASIRGDVAIPIARDAELFSICVRFLRKSKADLPGNVPRNVFLQELDYFGIPHELDQRNNIRNPTVIQSTQARPGRKGKCGYCPNCRREDCGECAMCLDMVKFGGPGTKRQRCLERLCMQEGSPPAVGKVKKQAEGSEPSKLISPEAKKEEASWEDEFAKIQAELNRKAEEAGKGGKTFGLATAISRKPSRSSTRNAERKRQRLASETSDDNDDDDDATYSSDLLQSVVEKGYAAYSKRSSFTGRKVPKRSASGHVKLTALASNEAAKPTADAQKRYDDAQKKKGDASKSQSSKAQKEVPGMVRGVTMRPSGKWQVQYYYCGSSRYIGVFESKEDALTAYETTREILGKEDTETLTKEQISNNINLARNAAFSERGLEYTGPQAKTDSLIHPAEQMEAPKQAARRKKLSEKERIRAVAKDVASEDEAYGDVVFETEDNDGRYSIKRCSAMACDEVAVSGDRCIAHRPLCSKKGCQKRVHSDGKCKAHLTSSRRSTPTSRAMDIPFGVGYKFRKQFDGDLFEGEVIDLLSGGGNDRRCKYLIDGFIEDLSVTDLKLLAQLEADNPVELGKVGYRFRKQFNNGWYDGIVVKVLKRGANGKDRRVHYSADDDFEDLSLEDLLMLASLDHHACDECRSRKIYCDGTQRFCLNNQTVNEEVEQQATEDKQSYGEDDDDSRSSRSRSSRGGDRKASSQKANPGDNEEDGNSFQPTDRDMILSLKDDKYRTALFEAFRKLGAKKEQDRDKDMERQTKLDVFNSFKSSGTRFVKHMNYRKPDLGLVEADDTYARDKINSDISRRLESKNRWDGGSDDEPSEDEAPAENLKYRPRVSVNKSKATAKPIESSSDESELTSFVIEQDESKRLKLNEKCSVHDSTCTIYDAVDVAPGWTVHVVPRKNGQHCPDKFFYSPTGEKFRSFISVKRHMGQIASPAKKRKRAASPAESVDSSFHNDMCECCGDLGELICCSTCNLVYHLECTRPILSELPEGDWSCAFCVAAGTGIDNSEPPLTKAEAIQGVKDIEGLKQQSLRNNKRMRLR